MKKVWMLLAVGFVLTGCADTQGAANTTESSAAVSSAQEKAEVIHVTVSVSVDGESIEQGTQELELEKDTNLLDAMKEHYEIEETDTFITSINGYSQDTEAGKYWLFDLNGEMAPAGANDTVLQEGDVVEWKLEAM